MSNICNIPYCKKPGAFIYYDREVCQRCWDKYQAEDQPPFALKKVLDITLEDPKPIQKEVTDEPEREVGD